MVILMDYIKPFKSISEQIQLLRSRGLIIDSDAEHYLRHLSYYRLAGYWLPFEEDHSLHLFKSNTYFDDVLNLYIFDRELRLILLDAIERVEVSVRTNWAHHCAQVYGAHAYLNSTIMRNKFWHQKNIDILKEEIKRSHEPFIQHYKKKYTSPEEPPIWVVCEIMSLGLLSRCLKNTMPSKICTEIAKSYQIDYAVLVSFIEHLTYLRNLCAHHSRIWNRQLTKTMKIPFSKPAWLINNFNQNSSGMRTIYNSLVMLIYFLNIISPSHHLKLRLINLIKKHAIKVEAMGFPDNWEQRNIWRD